MERRPISSQIRAWLLGELPVWQAGGILADDQPARILDLYEDARRRRRPPPIAGHVRARAAWQP